MQLNTPTAVIIAGVIIAGAVYFKPATPAPNGGQLLGDPIPTPEAPTIEEFRAADETDFVRGNPNAKITIVEYSDLECPFCTRFHPTAAQLVEEYPEDVNWVYRHFPLETLHPGARPKALAAECAGEQGKFWEFVDGVFDAGIDLPLDELGSLATLVGVANASQFQECLDSEKYAEKVDNQTQEAQKAGGRGTPYSLLIKEGEDPLPINGAQPYEAVKAQLETLL